MNQSSPNNPQAVYFGQLPLGTYDITAIGKTKFQVQKAIRDKYNDIKSAHKPRDDQGRPRSFANYAEYSGLYIHEMSYGKAEWL